MQIARYVCLMAPAAAAGSAGEKEKQAGRARKASRRLSERASNCVEGRDIDLGKRKQDTTKSDPREGGREGGDAAAAG